MCNTCIHKIVCSKYIATGGVNNCEHFKEERKGRWVPLATPWGDKVTCSVCGRDLYVNEPGNGLLDIEDLHYCPNCGADMRGDSQ